MLPGLLRGPSHTHWSVPSPYPIFPYLYPTRRPATLRCGPTGSSSTGGPFCAPRTGCSSLPFLCGSCASLLTCWGLFLLAPPPGTRACSPPIRLLRCYFFLFFASPVAPLLLRLLRSVPPLPTRSVLFALRLCLWVLLFLFAPPPLPLCFLPPGPLLPACTRDSTTHVFGSRCLSVLVSCPFALLELAPWRSPAMPGGRPSFASLPSLPSLLLPPLPLPSPVSRPPPYCCSPAPCALRWSSPRQGRILRALTRLWAPALSSVLQADLGGLCRNPFRGVSPVVRPRQPPLRQLPDGRAGRPVQFNAGLRHGGSLRETWYILAPVLAPCAPLLPRCTVPLLLLLFLPWFPLLSPALLFTRALCVPLVPLCVPLPRPPVPSPRVTPFLPSSPPIPSTLMALSVLFCLPSLPWRCFHPCVPPVGPTHALLCCPYPFLRCRVVQSPCPLCCATVPYHCALPSFSDSLPIRDAMGSWRWGAYLRTGLWPCSWTG